MSVFGVTASFETCRMTASKTLEVKYHKVKLRAILERNFKDDFEARDDGFYALLVD